MHLIRFVDLKERGVCRSWAQLKRLQADHNFPLGRLLSPNVRVWDAEDEVAPWLDSRPVENAPLRGSAKARHERRMKGQNPDPIAA
jgi:hypothetical protein